jgi:hypothetical protein
MTGHLVARSVRTEREGNLEEAEEERERRVEVFVLPKKGQEALKRDNDESLSIGGGEVTRDVVKFEVLFTYLTSQSHCYNIKKEVRHPSTSGGFSFGL